MNIIYFPLGVKREVIKYVLHKYTKNNFIPLNKKNITKKIIYKKKH